MRLCALGLALACCLGAAPAPALEYPKAKRADTTDVYHGTAVADPYRWLEDVDSKDTKKWVAAQNELALPFLAKLPDRARLRARLTELWNYERFGLPKKAGGRYFYTRNDGLLNQPVLYVQDAPKAEPRVLLDPNALAADGTVALGEFEPSPDGKLLAYSLASAGSDWNEFRVKDVATGADAGDVLRRIKFSGLSWTRDGKGFFYSRYPDPPAAEKPGAAAGVFEDLAHQKLYYHRVGTPQADDVLVYENPAEPQWIYRGEVTDDGRFLFISIFRGAGNENRLYYKYLGNDGRKPALDGAVTPLVDDFGASYVPVGNEASVLYLLTDKDAARKRIVAVDLRFPDRGAWQTLIPESADVIDTALHAGRQLVVVYMHDATSRIQRFGMDGQPAGEFKLPGLGALTQAQGETQIRGAAGENELFYSYTSFNRPATNYRCDLRHGSCVVHQAPELLFKPEDYVTRQVFYTSRDGTRVPMFVSHRRGLAKNGRTPTLLYGYGGFEIALTPTFSVPNLAWMEQGGIFVQANLRGGGEYGRAWHEMGTRLRKQNVFDDFIAAAEYLVRNGYTAPAQLAVEGRSNGGLLVGAVVNQRPDLFAAALPAVGVMDMLRFHKFTIGWAWTQDYGSADDPAEFKALHAYSPYHNVKPGTAYPAVLVTTADHDDRVVPGHSFKYAAAVQAAQTGDRPVLIRIDVKAGHGAGKPTAKLIEEAADKLAFATHYTRPAD